MFSAITLAYPERPPIPSRIELLDPITRKRTIRAFSYGATLFDPKYKDICRKLREVVALCLCDKPGDRPEPDALQAVIAEHLRSKNWVERDSDAAMAQWVVDNMDTALVIPGQPAPGNYWVDQS